MSIVSCMLALTPQWLPQPRPQVTKGLQTHALTLGSMTCATPSTPSSLSKAFRSTLHAILLPLPLGPTIIKPW